MAGLKELAKKITSINLDSLKAEVIDENLDAFVSKQKDQLWDGLASTGNDLSPSYSNDPYFKSPKAAEAYAAWKWKITPNPRRDRDAPNLYINGYFYEGIKANRSGDKLNVRSETSIGNEIENKYNNLFGLTPENRDEWDKENIQEYLKKWLTLSGL